jgi:hypothetical protein
VSVTIFNSIVCSLTCLVNWQDNARDLLQFLSYYLPEHPGSNEPVHLEPLPSYIANTRRRDGFSHRRVISAGHSLGGTSTYVIPAK